MRMRSWQMALMLAALFAGPSAWAGGGFAVPEMGARAAGMANAFTAVADDPSAVWYNPAGVGFQKRGVLIGGDVLFPTTSVEQGGASYGMKKQTFFVPTAYLVWPFAGKFALGLGINAPFGLATDWSGSGAPFSRPIIVGGRPTGASITKSEIQAIHYNPNLAIKISDALAVAFGVSYYDVRALSLDSAILTIHGSGHGWGANAAILWRGDTLSLGASWRSRVKLKASGTAQGIGLLAAAGSTHASTSVTLPDVLDLGAAWKLGPYTLSATMEWMNWKTFDKIQVDLVPSTLTGPFALNRTRVVVPENWKAVWDFRFGVNWRYDPRYEARAGVMFQKTPVNEYNLSPRLPDADRWIFSIGLSRDWKAGSLDVAYAFVRFASRTVTANRVPAYTGRYKTRVHILSADWRWRF